MPNNFKSSMDAVDSFLKAETDSYLAIASTAEGATVIMLNEKIETALGRTIVSVMEHDERFYKLMVEVVVNYARKNNDPFFKIINSQES